MHRVDDASSTPLNLKLIRPGARHGVTPHLTSKILSALGLLVHPNPGLPPRSPSQVCSWQPRMTPKHVFQSSATHLPRQIPSPLGLLVHPFPGFHPGPPQGFKRVFQGSATHSPCQILSPLGLPIYPFPGFHPGPPQGFKRVLLVKVSMHL